MKSTFISVLEATFNVSGEECLAEDDYVDNLTKAKINCLQDDECQSVQESTYGTRHWFRLIKLFSDCRPSPPGPNGKILNHFLMRKRQITREYGKYLKSLLNYTVL